MCPPVCPAASSYLLNVCVMVCGARCKLIYFLWGPLSHQIIGQKDNVTAVRNSEFKWIQSVTWFMFENSGHFSQIYFAELNISFFAFFLRNTESSLIILSRFSKTFCTNLFLKRFFIHKNFYIFILWRGLKIFVLFTTKIISSCVLLYVNN